MIYFDHAATGPISPKALEAFNLANGHFANPESLHKAGYEAKNYLERTREATLALLGLSSSHRLIFASGATEANNLAIRGILQGYPSRGHKILTSKLEHPSVLNVMEYLDRNKLAEVVYLSPDEDGSISPEEVARHMDDEVLLVSIMAVNNETGALSDIEGIARALKKYPKAIFHTDATQALGKIPLKLDEVDLISYSSHKFGGPKGTGGLFVRKGILLSNILYGGDQEEGTRPGTESYPLAVSSYIALEEAVRSIRENHERADRIRRLLLDWVDGSKETTSNSTLKGSPYILNFSLKHKKASVIVEALSNKSVYVSSVSACSSKHSPYSHVLKEMGKSQGDYENSIRLSFGQSSTLDEAREFIRIIEGIFKEVKDRGQ